MDDLRCLWLGLVALLAGCSAAGPADLTGADHPLAGQIHRLADRQRLSEADLIGDLGRARFVLIGEKHDNPEHHRLQVRLVAALQDRSRRPRAVAFEMIAGDRQLEVVEYLSAHAGDAAGLGQALDWAETGWPPWSAYQPIAQAGLDADAQIAAADLSAAQKRAVFGGELASLPAAMVHRTGLDRGWPAPLTSALMEELVIAHCGQAPAQVVQGMYRVQRARDAMMADRLAVASGRAGGILIAGNGHIRTDRGVPWYLGRIDPSAAVASVGLIEVHEQLTEFPADLPYDYVWFTQRVDTEDPCEANATELRRLDSDT